MESVKELQKNTFKSLKDEFKYKNSMQAPKLSKVVLNVGVGKTKADKKKMEIIEDSLAKITGQKAAIRPAKKSIATFKVREGQLSGYQVTLRGNIMYSFVDKLIHIALPRTKDFRGLNTTIDEMGNYTIGIKESSIFPEITDVDIKDIFGMSITLVTTSKTKEETKALLKHLGFPLKEEKREEK